MEPEEEVFVSQEGMPPNPFSYKNVKRLFSYLAGKHMLMLVFVFLCIIISSYAASEGTAFIQNLIDNYIEPLHSYAKVHGKASVDYSGLASALGFIAVLYLGAVVTGFIQTQIMLRISNNVLKDVRNDLFQSMQKLPISYFDTHSYGDVMSHYTNDVDVIRQMIETIPTVVNSASVILATLYQMIRMSWQLTIPVVLGTVVMVYVMGKLGGRSAKYFMQQQESLGSVDGYIEELINGQKVVKSFTYEKRAKKIFKEKNDDLCEKSTKANTVAGIMMPIMSSIGDFIFLLIALISGFLAIKCGITTITVGVVAAFLGLITAFVGPVASISDQVRAVGMAMAGASRIFELMDEMPEVDEGYVSLVHCKRVGDELIEVSEEEAMAHKDSKDYFCCWKHPHQDGTLTYKEVRGDVRLNDVDFSYDGKKQVLFGISVYAEPGQKVAFVGATGAGKTTITNLINRFYEIEDGKIRYDDINISKIKKSDLRRSLGIVLQDIHLFTGTVMENIRYGNLNATDEECIAAAKLANAHDFISKLPNGYNTELSANGSELSQGQCQLIAIARTAVANPQVMILDEATSSIDTRTEALVQRGMDALMENRTVFVIAHRLSTVKNSEAIIVMEDGHIIERGDHASLIAEKGKYYQLYTGVFELE